VFGAGGFWLGVVAVLLLVITDYLVARVLASLIEWLSRVRGGTAILGLMLLTVCILPSMLAPRMATAQGFIQRSMLALRFSPPFAAAALVVHPNKSSLIFNLGLMAEWIVFLLAALAMIERASADRCREIPATNSSSRWGPSRSSDSWQRQPCAPISLDLTRPGFAATSSCRYHRKQSCAQAATRPCSWDACCRR